MLKIQFETTEILALDKSDLEYLDRAALVAMEALIMNGSHSKSTHYKNLVSASFDVAVEMVRERRTRRGSILKVGSNAGEDST